LGLAEDIGESGCVGLMAGFHSMKANEALQNSFNDSELKQTRNHQCFRKNQIMPLALVGRTCQATSPLLNRMVITPAVKSIEWCDIGSPHRE